MLTRGGHKVQAGTYWNMTDGSRTDMAVEGMLPGGLETMYLRAPGIAVLAAGPVLGLLFAVFLPFIGIAMAISLAVKKIAAGLASAAAGSVSFGWRPIEAYLAGRKRKKEARGKKEGKGSPKQ